MHCPAQPPYEALTGRRPNLLRDFERPGTTECNELDAGGKMSFGINRLREIAISALVAGTSADRGKRALRSKTRPATEELNLSVGRLLESPSYEGRIWMDWARHCCVYRS